jgi:hypothetical protein
MALGGLGEGSHEAKDRGEETMKRRGHALVSSEIFLLGQS